MHEDERGVQRIVTPLEYAGSHDQVVLRARPIGDQRQVDENGEAALYARMSGGDVESDSVQRWVAQLEQTSQIDFDDETLTAKVLDSRLLAPTLFRVASAAQQLYALATAHKEREASDFKEQVAQIVTEICKAQNVSVEHNVRLPISGDLEADHLIGDDTNPIIVIAATSAKRLLKAEVIHMQYRLTKTPEFELAVAESQKVVGIKQFNRANDYTGKRVQFSPVDFAQFLRAQVLH